MLASALCGVPVLAGDPPPGLARKVAERETAAEKARSNYAYRQSVVVEEYASRGAAPGRYQEIREVIFSPSGERTERMVGSPINNLQRLRLTEEDFHDIREVQPFLLTADMLWLYKTEFKGEELVDGEDCWVLRISPRQLHHGQRMFDGMVWVSKADFGVFKSEGVAVPPVIKRGEENLFPRFTTFRAKVDGEHWFPILTHSDDTLAFSTGAIRQRMTIKFENYQRFGATSTVTFDEPK